MVLIFFGILLLVISDYSIRIAKDSWLKRLWLKVIKKPIFERIEETFKTLIKKLEDKYGKHPDHPQFFNYEKFAQDISKRYAYKIIFFAILLILLGILYNILIFFK
jgi:hypothetical protein